MRRWAKSSTAACQIGSKTADCPEPLMHPSRLETTSEIETARKTNIALKNRLTKPEDHSLIGDQLVTDVSSRKCRGPGCTPFSSARWRGLCKPKFCPMHHSFGVSNVVG